MTTRHADVDGAQQGEDKCLDEGHQQFQTAHEYVEEDGHHRHTVAEGGCHLPEDEYQRDETQHNDVAGGDVGKKTDHQHERLREDADQLHKRHDRGGQLQPPGHARRVENVHPILLAGGKRRDEEGDQGQDTRNGDIARQVGAAWKYRNQPHKVVQQDEEEEREQIRCIFVGMFSQRWIDDLVLQEHDHRFHQGLHSPGSLVGPLLVLLGHRKEYPRNEYQRDKEGAHILGDGNVEFAHMVHGIFAPFFQRTRVVIGQLHDGTLLVAPAQRIALVGRMAVMELAGHEDHRTPPIDQNHRQRDSDTLVALTTNMPSVTVCYVVDNEGTRLETIAGSVGRLTGNGKKEAQNRHDGDGQYLGYFSTSHNISVNYSL